MTETANREKSKLRILHLEDNPMDAKRIALEIAMSGLGAEVIPVDTKSAFDAILTEGDVDLILSDMNIEGFGGDEALEIAKARIPEAPFIVVSGSIGDVDAVEMIKRGATDYVLKDNPARLSHAIERALREVEARRKHLKLEEQLRQSQKMEAVGRLAGGVAHDFNNLLTAILGYTEMLLDHFKPNDPIRKDLVEIDQAAERAAALTKQLLAFSRKQVLETKILHLDNLISGFEKILTRLIGEDINLTTASDPNLGAVRADPGQMEQVILNLVVNARDAMPNGGKISIETRNVQVGKEFPDLPAGDYVMLAISDTGVGMTPDVQARMFEPFFTTKELGKGTGLGLSTCYGIVQQHGGRISVYSEPGVGTTFKIYLPQVRQKAEQKREAASQGSQIGTETVLIVEDQPQVLGISKKIATQQGYRILSAQDPEEAIRLAGRHPGPIHLILTDIVMPKMNGRDLAERIRAVHPEAKVLYMSGYTADILSKSGVLESGFHLIHKPFKASALAAKLREVLDAAP